jgi:hypothetical protein
MIEVNNEREQYSSDWQSSFLNMLSEIQRRLRSAFRHLDHASKEEAIEEGIVHCLLAYVRLHDQGRAHVATPANLAFYSSKHVKRGRPAAGRMNGKDVLSRYAQIGNGIQIDDSRGQWIEMLVEDKRAPVPDQVAAKMDVGAWWETLTKRMKEIAKDLALGCSTSEVAEKHGVTAGRISQFRRTLEASWAAFQRETAVTAARCRHIERRPPKSPLLQAKSVLSSCSHVRLQRC